METNATESGHNSRRLPYPFLMVLIGAVLLLATLFMPYATATREHKERLLSHPDYVVIPELGMTNKGAVHMSLVDYTRVYGVAIGQGRQKEVAVAGIVIILAFAVFSALTLLMSICKRPIAIIVFEALALVAFQVIHFDFEDRGVIPSSSYQWGMANYLFYILELLILAGAVWMLVEKRKQRKQCCMKGEM